MDIDTTSYLSVTLETLALCNFAIPKTYKLLPWYHTWAEIFMCVCISTLKMGFSIENVQHGKTPMWGKVIPSSDPDLVNMRVGVPCFQKIKNKHFIVLEILK
jgi:hypothetical protein